MIKLSRFLGCALLFLVAWASSASAQAILPHQPTVHGRNIVFVYADKLWSVGLKGGQARLLSTGAGTASDPHFSPDGRMIAFSLEQDDNEDVYVMSAAGGVPKRLTWHPGDDEVSGWTADGQSILFRSRRHSYQTFDRLFTVSKSGGLPRQVPLPLAVAGEYSPNGKHLAYVPMTNMGPNIAWKRYHGGRQARIWIARLADSSITRIPRKNSQDFNPMWVGNKIYFLSDRNGFFTLYRYDTRDQKVHEMLPAKGPDIKSASADSGRIVYETVGALHVFNTASGKTRRLNVKVSRDLADLEPHFVKAGDEIINANISPTGVRAVFEAHGDILTVPAEKGDTRNVTHTPGAADRFPAWSPDGKWIAYFSDRSGEYALYLSPQNGLGKTKKINLGAPPSYYYSPVFSPDSKKIAYTDKRLNLWYVDIAKRKPVKVATDFYETPERTLDPVFSPDSRYLAYTRLLANHMRAVDVYSLKTGQSHQITDGMSDARYAAWDKDGKYLYFTASTNIGPTTGWLDLSSYERPVTRSVYAAVLRKDLPSPLAPELGNDKGVKQKDEHDASHPKSEPPPAVKIDFADIGQRIVSLPLAAKNIANLQAGRAGTLFVTEAPTVAMPGASPGGQPIYSVQKFDLDSRETKPFLNNVVDFEVSADGDHLLYAQPDEEAANWFIAKTDTPPKPEQAKQLNVDDMQVWVEPRSEWKQMYQEAWRIERDFFYDKNLHGLDLSKAKKLYQPYIKNLASRSGLNYIFNDMLGEITVGHMFISGPPRKASEQPPVGLLGADYTIAHNRYRFARVYSGENWNPELIAPLTQPGVNVHSGDYLFAVNGRALRAGDNVYSFFQGTAGKQTVLKVGSNANGQGARTVTVVPIADEMGLRNRAWVSANLQKVDKLSHGKVAYVYLPDTAAGGYANFNRYFFSQVNKPALVLDERFNHGGQAADYFIDYLRRRLMSYWYTRQGHNFTTPVGAIFGPKAMITNMFAGSGGDALPWYFKYMKIGPTIGTRTWGGLIGIYDYPQLMDGGMITAPRVAFYNPQGQWDVENHGVPPDIRVAYSPAAWRKGHDPQLEKAVHTVLKALKKHPLKHVKHPPFPNYHQHPAASPPEPGGGG